MQDNWRYVTNKFLNCMSFYGETDNEEEMKN